MVFVFVDWNRLNKARKLEVHLTGNNYLTVFPKSYDAHFSFFNHPAIFKALYFKMDLHPPFFYLHYSTSILLPPSLYFNPSTSILLPPSLYLHPYISILLPPSIYLYSSTSILLFFTFPPSERDLFSIYHLHGILNLKIHATSHHSHANNSKYLPDFQ